MAEWLRRLTRNQIPSGSAGSSPADCVKEYFWSKKYKKTVSKSVQGVRGQNFMFQFALTDRNIQARFGLRVVWEF